MKNIFKTTLAIILFSIVIWACKGPKMITVDGQEAYEIKAKGVDFYSLECFCMKEVECETCKQTKTKILNGLMITDNAGRETFYSIPVDVEYTDDYFMINGDRYSFDKVTNMSNGTDVLNEIACLKGAAEEHTHDGEDVDYLFESTTVVYEIIEGDTIGFTINYIDSNGDEITDSEIVFPTPKDCTDYPSLGTVDITEDLEDEGIDPSDELAVQNYIAANFDGIGAGSCFNLTECCTIQQFQVDEGGIIDDAGLIDGDIFYYLNGIVIDGVTYPMPSIPFYIGAGNSTPSALNEAQEGLINENLNHSNITIGTVDDVSNMDFEGIFDMYWKYCGSEPFPEITFDFIVDWVQPVNDSGFSDGLVSAGTYYDEIPIDFSFGNIDCQITHEWCVSDKCECVQTQGPFSESNIMISLSDDSTHYIINHVGSSGQEDVDSVEIFTNNYFSSVGVPNETVIAFRGTQCGTTFTGFNEVNPSAPIDVRRGEGGKTTIQVNDCSDNILINGNDVAFTTFGVRNIALGVNAGNLANLTQYNNFIGAVAGYQSNIGQYNNIFGGQAGQTLTAGSNNNIVGNSTGFASTILSNNNITGFQAGSIATLGSFNDISGFQAARQAVGGSGNQAYGILSMYGSTFNIYNSAVGYKSFNLANMDSYNLAMGANAGDEATMTSFNTMISQGAGAGAEWGGDNIAVGTKAGFESVWSDFNSVFGRRSGDASIWNSTNIAQGPEAGNASVWGVDNSAVGSRSAASSIAEAGNTYHGYLSGESSSKNSNNSFFGSWTNIDNVTNATITQTVTTDVNGCVALGANLAILLAGLTNNTGGAYANGDIVLLQFGSGAVTSYYPATISDLTLGIVCLPPGTVVSGQQNITTFTNGSVSNSTALGYHADIEHDNQVVIGNKGLDGGALTEEVQLNGFVKLPLSFPPTGVGVDDGSFFKGSDGALYYKSDAGTVTQIAPN